MSTVVVGGGGPRPQARIVSVFEESGAQYWEIRDGDEILMRCAKQSHAIALLPLLKSGE